MQRRRRRRRRRRCRRVRLQTSAAKWGELLHSPLGELQLNGHGATVTYLHPPLSKSTQIAAIRCTMRSLALCLMHVGVVADEKLGIDVHGGGVGNANVARRGINVMSES